MSEEIVDVDNREITVVDKKTGEIVEDTPENLLMAASEAAKALERVIELNERPPLMFNGKRYLEVHHWQTIAKFYHSTVSTSDPEFVEIAGIMGFKAKAAVLDEKTGLTVGGAEAFCMRDEANWKSKPIYQLASMAQTRAMSKALSNKFRFVAIVAGYEGTPAEEMNNEAPQRQVNMPKARSGAVPQTESPAPIAPPVQEKAPAPAPSPKPGSPAPDAGGDTKSQSKFFIKLHAVAREKKVTAEAMKQMMAQLFHKESSKDLTDAECVKIIKIIEGMVV